MKGIESISAVISDYRTGLFVIYAYVGKFKDIKSFLKPYLQKMEIGMI